MVSDGTGDPGRRERGEQRSGVHDSDVRKGRCLTDDGSSREMKPSALRLEALYGRPLPPLPPAPRSAIADSEDPAETQLPRPRQTENEALNVTRVLARISLREPKEALFRGKMHTTL
jgi:hypothetical protein